MSCTVVVGAQWGDEGKGKIVDVLVEEADIVARYQGGANAGHTIVVGDEEFVLHQIPSGILHPAKICLLGNGVVVDPVALFGEIAALEERRIAVRGRLKISGKAHLVLSYHKRIDAAREGALGPERLGTTQRGIGPAYEDKAARIGIRLHDLEDHDLLIRRLQRNVEEKACLLARLGNDEPLTLEGVLAEIEAHREPLLSLMADASLLLFDALREGKGVLLEGAQGSMLDVDHGTYPYVTASNTTAGGAAVGVGIGPSEIDRVVGVVKAYTTRVGEGPLPTEADPETAGRLRERGREFGATTGRPRRCGWFDALVVRYARRLNGLTSLAVTKLDVLDVFPRIPICVGYRYRGQVWREFPGELGCLSGCEPIYEEFPGWERDTSEVRRPEDLPRSARAYLDRIEELVGCPVHFVSIGAKREEIIRMRPAFR